MCSGDIFRCLHQYGCPRPGPRLSDRFSLATANNIKKKLILNNFINALPNIVQTTTTEYTSIVKGFKPIPLLLKKCDLQSQNEYKVATSAIQNYYRFKFFIMQALNNK